MYGLDFEEASANPARCEEFLCASRPMRCLVSAYVQSATLLSFIPSLHHRAWESLQVALWASVQQPLSARSDSRLSCTQIPTGPVWFVGGRLPAVVFFALFPDCSSTCQPFSSALLSDFSSTWPIIVGDVGLTIRL